MWSYSPDQNPETNAPFRAESVPAAPHPCKGPPVWMTREEVRGSDVADRL